MKRPLQMIGYFIAGFGIWIILHTLFNWRTVPQAFIQVPKEVVKTVYAQPPADPHTGPTRVVHMWHSAAKGYENVPVGDYQFKDSSGLVLTLHFCDAPPPYFQVDSIVDVHFQYTLSFSTDKCVRLAWAQVLQEAK